MFKTKQQHPLQSIDQANCAFIKCGKRGVPWMDIRETKNYDLAYTLHFDQDMWNTSYNDPLAQQHVK